MAQPIKPTARAAFRRHRLTPVIANLVAVAKRETIAADKPEYLEAVRRRLVKRRYERAVELQMEHPGLDEASIAALEAEE